MAGRALRQGAGDPERRAVSRRGGTRDQLPARAAQPLPEAGPDRRERRPRAGHGHRRARARRPGQAARDRGGLFDGRRQRRDRRGAGGAAPGAGLLRRPRPRSRQYPPAARGTAARGAAPRPAPGPARGLPAPDALPSPAAGRRDRAVFVAGGDHAGEHPGAHRGPFRLSGRGARDRSAPARYRLKDRCEYNETHRFHSIGRFIHPVDGFHQNYSYNEKLTMA
ncbi:hypothetical protein BGLA2_1700020 [Burkholderia gladioli]|nr:hypothetical protein BGLA2_1700020 [Burkholderia gladioli]